MRLRRDCRRVRVICMLLLLDDAGQPGHARRRAWLQGRFRHAVRAHGRQAQQRQRCTVGVGVGVAVTVVSRCRGGKAEPDGKHVEVDVVVFVDVFVVVVATPPPPTSVSIPAFPFLFALAAAPMPPAEFFFVTLGDTLRDRLRQRFAPADLMPPARTTSGLRNSDGHTHTFPSFSLAIAYGWNCCMICL